jgi:glycosyltransferase involved in cell wall biosynthesis
MNEPALASLDRLRGSTKARVLFVSHGNAGGVARHVEDLARCLARDVEVLLLQPHRSPFIALRWMRKGESLRLYFDALAEWERLASVLAAIGIDRVHIHHVHGLPQAILDLARQLRCPHDATIHDYFAACPNYHMLDANGRYCAGDPGCGQCLDSQPAQWPLSIGDWRDSFGRVLRSASRVIAPSADCATRIAAFFPGIAPVVWPHPEGGSPEIPRQVRVLVPGAISRAKGMDLLEACVADSATRDLGLHFRVLGFVARPLATWPMAPLSISGEFPDGKLHELMAVERGDVCFLPSQCPETFSYTLSAALDSGLPIVATGIGAFPERVAASPNARIVPWNASAQEINDVLVATVAPAVSSPAPRSCMTFDAYRRLYLAGWKSSREDAPGEAPTIEARWLAEPIAEPDRRPLAYFFEDGVICGKAASLEGLRRFAFDPDSLLASADGRVRELIALLASTNGRVRELIENAALAEENLKRIEGSSSWRITAPLRGLARRLRRRARP